MQPVKRAKVRIMHPRREPEGSRDLRLDLMDGSVVPTKDLVQKAFHEVWAGELNLHAEDPVSQLATLWRIVEEGGPHCPIPRLARLPNAIRSFVVGDVVELDGVQWYVAPFDWIPVGAVIDQEA